MTNTNSSNTIYLVTGAAGFLGETICRQLIGRGDAVRAFVLKNDPAMKFVPAQAEICEGDLTDMGSLSRIFQVEEGVETVVIHCASVVTVDPDFSQTVMNVNLGGTMNIINQCLMHPECKKLVYVISTGAIPERPKGQPIYTHLSEETMRRASVNLDDVFQKKAKKKAAKSGANARSRKPPVDTSLPWTNKF